MSSIPPLSRQPRRGQALLLAVLIMIFAALVSASFIAIVSVNLNQSARQTDKNRSVVAARAGLDYVKNRLAYSADGDKWRNELENVPPAPGDPDYTFYYTPLEVAQGWARTTPHPGDTNNNGIANDPEDERLALVKARVSGKLELVKLPDPRVGSGQRADVPSFLSQVERVALNSGTEQAGALKITVVGLSNEDPTAYTRVVAYFGGYKNAPIAQTMRAVGNWDFVTGKSLVAQSNPTVGNGTGTPATLGITNAQGDFSKLGRPFTVTISNPRDVTPPLTTTRNAVVTDVAKTSPTTFVLTLAQATTAVGSDDRVELAANFGAPSGIDYDNNPATAGTPFTTSASGLVNLSDGVKNATTNEVDGARVNAGLVWSGDLLTTKLRGMTTAFAANQAPGNIFVSGVMALDATAVAPQINFAKTSDVAPVGTLQASATSGIFTNAASADYQIVSDGWNLLAGTASSNGTRNVTDFRPPVIDIGEAVERYRNMTRMSQPNAVATNPDAPVARHALDGYGLGIYIDNVQDIERLSEDIDVDGTLDASEDTNGNGILDGTEDVNTNGVLDASEDSNGNGVLDVGLREMTQTELVQMWLSSSAIPRSYERIGRPITAAAPIPYRNTSLEQQHLRGWVGPDEFRARGVEIELGNNSIIITRDPRDDNRGGLINAVGPVADKAWNKTVDGQPDRGIYRKVLPWPTNGVIFAEGNVRIKGRALNAPRSLTIVSMNNIYIEDSLSADADGDGVLTTPANQPRKILLMAKRNVVVNPTRVLGRPDAQTVSTSLSPVAVAVGGLATLTVASTSEFRARDFIETSSVVAGVDTISSTGQITAINSATSISVAIASAPAAQVVVASSVRSRSEKTPAVTSVTPYSVIGAPGDAIQRRFTVPALAPNLRVALNHSAERINGMNVKTEDFGGETKPASGIFLSNKRALDAAAANFVSTATRVNEANKRIRGDYSSPAPAGTDSFPQAALVSETLARLQNLTATKMEMEAKTHLDVPNSVGWKYTVTPTVGYETLPFYYLAGVGNRYDFGSFPPPALVPGAALVGWRDKILNSDIAATAAGYDMPVATSIGMWLNGPPTPSFFRNENWNGTTYDQTAAFGFDPNFLDATSSPNQEDILTADQSFYQLPLFTAPSAAPIKSTLDSRAFATPVIVGQNSLTLRQNALPLTVLSTAVLPEYRFLGMKLEDVALTASTSNTTRIGQGHVFDVNAFVYAQTGSWFVIPGPQFETRLHGDTTQAYFDLDRDNAPPEPGEYLNVDASVDGSNNPTYTAGDFPDLNRNGLLEDSERYAMIRYSRFNYSISFTGAIAENQTALVNDAGTTAKGAVADWMTKWATTSFDSTAATPITNNRIRYVFDPTVVLNRFQPDDPSTLTVDETDYGFRLPYNPEIFGVS